MLQDVAGAQPACHPGSVDVSSVLVVAFSGGADSVLAAHWAAEKIQDLPGSSLLLWYLHHYKTPVEPERVKIFAATQAKFPGAKLLQVQKDIATLSRRLGYSWEHTASLVRRKYLRRLAFAMNATIVTGHHYSDYLETLTLRRQRGIPEHSLPSLTERGDTDFLRPLFKMTREEVRSQVAALNLPYFDDPTNEDLKFARNRIRSAQIAPSPPAMPSASTPPSLGEKPWETPLPRLGEGSGVGRTRELRLPLADWEALSATEKARTIFSAFRRLAIVRKFTRNHFARAHRLPFQLPPFFAHTESHDGVESVVFRRGLGAHVRLPAAGSESYRRGDAVTARVLLPQKYGRKAVTKIFSERRLSPRQRRQTVVYCNADAPGEALRIVFPDGSELCAERAEALASP